jgi:predicted PurR-regulated permease PerM
VTRITIPSVIRYRLNFSFTSALLGIVAVVAAVVLTGVVSASSRPLGWALAAAIVAMLLTPIVALLGRRLPHWGAIVVSLLIVIIGLGGTWVAVSATLAENVDQITEKAPAAAGDLESRSQLAKDFQLERRVTSFVDDLNSRLGTRAQVQRTASTAPTYVVTGMLMLFLLIYGDRFVNGGLAQIDDKARRERVRGIIDKTVVTGRGYLLASIAKAVAITAVSLVTFVILGLDAAFVLALLVGGLSVIPYLGIVLGGLPALLLTVAFEDNVSLVIVLVLVVGLQLLDGIVIQPRIDERTIHVGPALPLIVGLIGWQLYGLGGAMYGVAVLVMLVALAHAASTDDHGVGVVTAGDDVVATANRPPQTAG